MGEVKKVSRFVRPEVVRLPLSGGDWVEVARELTVGEQRRAMARIVTRIGGIGGGITPDLAMVGKAEISAYIKDWSFVDANDKRVPFTEDALDALTVETYQEIEAALEAHKAAVEAERKNDTSGSSSN